MRMVLAIRLIMHASLSRGGPVSLMSVKERRAPMGKPAVSGPPARRIVGFLPDAQTIKARGLLRCRHHSEGGGAARTRSAFGQAVRSLRSIKVRPAVLVYRALEAKRHLRPPWCLI